MLQNKGTHSRKPTRGSHIGKSSRQGRTKGGLFTDGPEQYRKKRRVKKEKPRTRRGCLKKLESVMRGKEKQPEVAL